MLTTHPPMQMDGNFGIVGGICEMLVQSHAGGLDIMPSPVEAWPEGSVKGLKAGATSRWIFPGRTAR